MNDTELQEKLILLRHGDRTAFEEIYNEMKTPVFTILLRITQNRELSEDILQEFFIKLFRSPPQSPVQKPRAYLFRTARNLAVDGIKKQPQYADIDDYEHLQNAPSCDSAEKLDLDNAFKMLSLLERQIVTMHVNGDLKFREIAAIVNKPLGTVLWKYQQAIRKLRSILDGGAL